MNIKIVFMRILLVGTGAVASVVSKLLAKENDISEISCVSNDMKGAKKFMEENEKITVKYADASSIRDLKRHARGFDLIINASRPKYNENIMKVALKAGANYQDTTSYLGGFSKKLKDLKNVEQLKYHKKFEKENLVALINTGVAPGISNLLAAEASEGIGDIYEIRIRFLEEQKSERPIFSWSPEGVIDELSAPPLVYRNGRFMLAKNFGDEEIYEFPVGRRKVMNIFCDEVATLPLYIKTRNVSGKGGGSEMDMAKKIYEEKKEIKSSIPDPGKMKNFMKKGIIEHAYFLLSIESIGREKRKKLSAIFPDINKINNIFPGANHISYPTGLAIAAFCKSINKIDKYGVFPPEALNRKTRKSILATIRKMDNSIVIKSSF